MLRFAADENFNRKIIRGLRRRNPEIDIVTVQKHDLRGADDSVVLEWAAGDGRVLLSHDEKTIRGLAYHRIANGEAVPGVILIPQYPPLGQVIEALELAVGASLESEWENRVEYLRFS